jgi:hypothetical protein
MVKIIALTTDGGMVVGKLYEVGAEIASTLIKVKRARLASDKQVVEEIVSENEIVEDTTKTTKRKNKQK